MNGSIRPKTAKYRLTVDTTVELNGVNSADIQAKLHEGVKHLVDNGLLTGSTAAVLKTVKVSSKQVK